MIRPDRPGDRDRQQAAELGRQAWWAGAAGAPVGPAVDAFAAALAAARADEAEFYGDRDQQQATEVEVECWNTADTVAGYRDKIRTALAAARAGESARREALVTDLRALADELATVACDHSASVAGDAYADAADRILAVLDGTYP